MVICKMLQVTCESFPQSIIQLILYFTCTDNSCGFDANEKLDLYFFELNTSQTLILSLSLSLASLIRLIISVYITTQAMGISVRQYLQHLIELGGGLNLDAIRLNKIETLTFFDLPDSTIDEICNVLQNNKSVKTFRTDWDNLSDGQVEKWVSTGHSAVLSSYYGHLKIDYKSVGSAIVVACEKKYFNVVKHIVENYDKETAQL